MPDDADDDALLELLGRALNSADPVPGPVHDGAVASFDFRDPDAALAAMATEALAGVRDDEGAGPLVFETEHVEIAVTVDGGRLVGQLAPPSGCDGVVESPKAGPVPFRTDELGRFTVEVGPGPVRVVVEHAGGRVRTGWFYA